MIPFSPRIISCFLVTRRLLSHFFLEGHLGPAPLLQQTRMSGMLCLMEAVPYGISMIRSSARRVVECDPVRYGASSMRSYLPLSLPNFLRSIQRQHNPPRLPQKHLMHMQHQIPHQRVPHRGRQMRLSIPVMPHQLPTTIRRPRPRTPIRLRTRQHPDIPRPTKLIPNMAPKRPLLVRPPVLPHAAPGVPDIVGARVPRLEEFLGSRALLRDYEACV